MCIIEDRIEENAALIAQNLHSLAQLEFCWHTSRDREDSALDRIAGMRASIIELEGANAILRARLRDDRNRGPTGAFAM